MSTSTLRRGAEWLLKYYLIDVKEYDIVVGYRADDSYFSFARAFLSNQISMEQLSYAMRLGKLGEQVVLISEQAFKRLEYVSSEATDASVYFTLEAHLFCLNTKLFFFSFVFHQEKLAQTLQV